MHPHDFLGHELTQLPSGRMFCRTNGGTGFIGLVEMPAYIATESLRQFRLNDHIWVDAQHSRVASARHSHNPDEPSYFGTHAASNLLTDLQFGQSILPDGLECFVRKSFLPHENPEMSWNILVSAKRTHLPAMPKDGLYEFSGGACKLISEHPYNGSNIGQVFNEPIWGPGGQFALNSTMEIEAYKQWIGPEQERNMARDPLFKKFVLAMNALGEMPMYMTREEAAVRETQCDQVMRQMMDAEDGFSP